MNSQDKRDQTYEVWSDTRHCTNKKLVFWHKFHLSYAKLAQFLCLPGFLCLSPPSGCEPALLQLWWRWTQTHQTSALSEEKHRCFMFCMRITPVDCQRKVCGLINTIITLTENMHGNDCSLVYCNQWKWGWVTPLAKAVHRGTVNDYWRKKKRRT